MRDRVSYTDVYMISWDHKNCAGKSTLHLFIIKLWL